MDKEEAAQSVNTESKPATNDGDLSPKKRAVEEANKRQKQITDFVVDTVESNKKRIKTKEVYQNIIAISLLCIVGIFFLGLVSLIILAATKVIGEVVPLVSALGSVLLGFVSSVISLLLVVVKYIFPSNEDETKMNTLTNILHDDNGLFLEEHTEKKTDIGNN